MAALAALTVVLVPVLPASAAPIVTATPEPSTDTLAVGDTNVPVALRVRNESTSPESSLSFTVDALAFAPSCVNYSNTTCITPDPNVFSVSQTGTGRAGTICGGQLFVFNAPDANGVVSITLPSGGIVLGPTGAVNDTCVIDFTVSVLKMPTTDTRDAQTRTDLPGVQTTMVGFVHATASGGTIGVSTSRGRSVTIVKDTPTITTQASPGVFQGGSVFDAATLTNATNPTGSLTFALYGPNDPSCATAPIYSTIVNINGTGSYQAPAYTPAAPGLYRWRVFYSGDANNNAVSTPCPTNDPSEWAVVQSGVPGDYDRDRDTDIAVYRPSNGTWYVLGVETVTWGFAGDIPVPADYDGDGDTDVAVFRPSTGTWYILGGNTVVFGAEGDIPVPADYDGDGKADIAVYRPSTGVWYIRQSSAGPAAVVFGTNGDIPVPADYDGDGKADIAVFRPSTGVWYIQRSTAGPAAVVFGTSGDIPVPADYDGDRRADIAVFRPSAGVWYIQQSTAGPVAVAFGTSGDIPAPGDYDGDGRADIAVFRPSNGVWYVQRTTAGPLSVPFGTSGDVPLPLPDAIRRFFFS